MNKTTDCNENVLNANDDSSTAPVPLPFGVNFYGSSFQSLWVNNNGNVTFDGPLSTYTPIGLAGTSSQIIAPFFADADTRSAGSQPVAYVWGETTYEGLGGDFGLDVIKEGSPTSARVSCPSDAQIVAVEEAATAGASSLSYDVDTQTYNYVWKTEPSWAGTCRVFQKVLSDGNSHRATFRFVR